MTDNIGIKIKKFFESTAYGVAGASTNREKYGNKVLRCYIQHDKKVYAINPRAQVIEDVVCIADVASLPNEVKSISIITPPKITEEIVAQAIKHHIKNIWMQPGAENATAIKNAEMHGINVIANGPCILVVLGFHEN